MSIVDNSICDPVLERPRPLTLARAHFSATDRIARAKGIAKRRGFFAHGGSQSQASFAIGRNIRDAHRHLVRLAELRPETITEAAAMVDVVRECLARYDDPDLFQAKVYGPRILGDILDRIAEGLAVVGGNAEPCGRAPRPFCLARS